MRFAAMPFKSLPKAQEGFTLVELITVVIVLGVVAVAAAPRFLSTDSFAEFALQQRLQSALRTLQIQSMYDTRANFCYKLNFATGNSPGFGVPTNDFTSGNQSLSCANSIDYTLERYMRSDVNELSNDGIEIVALDSGISMAFIEFNALGQPSSNVGTCAGGCEVSFVGSQQAKLCISSEGYVHGC
jgi:MSHA pilin protein MshC